MVKSFRTDKDLVPSQRVSLPHRCDVAQTKGAPCDLKYVRRLFVARRLASDNDSDLLGPTPCLALPALS
jgi:hypothetical protein